MSKGLGLGLSDCQPASQLHFELPACHTKVPSNMCGGVPAACCLQRLHKALQKPTCGGKGSVAVFTTDFIADSMK